MSLIESDVIEPGSQEILKIYTLGRYQVRRGGRVLSNKKCSYKLCELFKFLVTFRGKDILPEAILEMLWPEAFYKDPRSALRTPIYRIRQLLMDNQSFEKRVDYIIISNGCYQWNTAIDYWLDAEEFEKRCREAEMLVGKDSVRSIELYKEALSLYKGQYLAECLYSEWLVPVRNYYHNLYLQSVLNLADLLNSSNRYGEIIEACEKAIMLEPLDEEIHLRLMEALLKLGKKKRARSHYEYATAVLYREMGSAPSLAMRNVYNLSKNENVDYIY